MNGERNINAKLTVIPMNGWLRGDWFDSTGLCGPIPTSDVHDLEQELLYSRVGR